MNKAIQFFLLVIFMIPQAAQAQMFSVEEKSNPANPFAPYLRAGVKSVDFNYTGNSLITERPFEFTGLAYTVAFESSGFTLRAALGDDFSGLDNIHYFDLGISFFTPFYIVRRPSFYFGVPIKLSSIVTTVRNDNFSDEFSQTNLSAGAGAIAQLHIPGVFGMNLHLIPNYGFSTAGGGFIGGSVFSLDGKARINFYNVLFGKNLSLGYNYEYMSYDIDDNIYDYDFNAHTITIGISF